MFEEELPQKYKLLTNLEIFPTVTQIYIWYKEEGTAPQKLLNSNYQLPRNFVSNMTENDKKIMLDALLEIERFKPFLEDVCRTFLKMTKKAQLFDETFCFLLLYVIVVLSHPKTIDDMVKFLRNFRQNKIIPFLQFLTRKGMAYGIVRNCSRHFEADYLKENILPGLLADSEIFKKILEKYMASLEKGKPTIQKQKSNIIPDFSDEVLAPCDIPDMEYEISPESDKSDSSTTVDSSEGRSKKEKKVKKSRPVSREKTGSRRPGSRRPVTHKYGSRRPVSRKHGSRRPGTHRSGTSKSGSRKNGSRKRPTSRRKHRRQEKPEMQDTPTEPEPETTVIEEEVKEEQTAAEEDVLGEEEEEHVSSSSDHLPVIKRNAAALLREAAIISKEEDKKAETILGLLQGANNHICLEQYEEKLRTNAEKARLHDIKRKHLVGLITREEAILAKQAVTLDNIQKRKKFEREKRALQRRLRIWKRREALKIKKLVLQCHETEENIKLKQEDLLLKKKDQAKAIMEESIRIQEMVMKEKEEELQRKTDLIREIRAIHSISLLRNEQTKEFDFSETMNFGFLCEMSLEELKERLTILKVDMQREIEKKKKMVRKVRQKQKKKIEDAETFINDYRAEIMARKQVVEEVKPPRPSIIYHLPSPRTVELDDLRMKLEKAKEQKRNFVNKLKEPRTPPEPEPSVPKKRRGFRARKAPPS